MFFSKCTNSSATHAWFGAMHQTDHAKYFCKSSVTSKMLLSFTRYRKIIKSVYLALFGHARESILEAKCKASKVTHFCQPTVASVLLPNLSQNWNTDKRYYCNIFCRTIAYGTVSTSFVHYTIFNVSSVSVIFI